MSNGLLSVDEALARLLAAARPVSDTESVPTLAATGRVLAQAQTSTLNVPPLDNTAMDGYAVRVGRLRLRRGAAPRRAADPRRDHREAARARHRGAHLHRRADSAGGGCGGPAGTDRARRRSGRHQARAAARRMDPAGGRGHPRRRDHSPGRHAAAGAGDRARRIGRDRAAAGVPQGEGGALLHRQRARDARRAAASGRDLQLEPVHAHRPPADARVRGRGSGHRAGHARRDPRSAAQGRRDERPHRHLGRRVGRRRGSRQARGGGRGAPRPVAHRDEAGPAARVRRGAARGRRRSRVSSACPGIRCRAS